MTFFTLDNHHDLAIIEVGRGAPSPDPRATGLAHVSFTIGDSREYFGSMRCHLDSAKIDILYAAERSFTTSLHVQDPDGNDVELYIDNPTTTRPRRGPARAPTAAAGAVGIQRLPRSEGEDPSDMPLGPRRVPAQSERRKRHLRRAR